MQVTPSSLNPGAFLYGISDSVPDSAWLSSAECFRQVGGNTGNIAFHHAISRQLGLSGNVAWDAPREQLAGSGRLAVMPCANQVGIHVDMQREAGRIAEVEFDIVAIGLGAQSSFDLTMPEVPEGTQAWIREIVKRAPGKHPNISVRGEFSRRVMESLGFGEHVEALGCPSLFMNPDPTLGRTLEARFTEPRNVCVVSGHYLWSGLAAVEASLAGIVTRSQGAYIMQSPLEMVALGRGDLDSVSAQALSDCRDFCMPCLSIEQFKDWIVQFGRSFFDVHGWMDYLRRFDLVIGARIHGVMLALQAGVPAICIAHDSRTMELCEIMRVPHVLARTIEGGIARSQLAGLWDFDGDAFDRNREVLAQRYSEFLRRNGLACNALIQSLPQVEP